MHLKQKAAPNGAGLYYSSSKGRGRELEKPEVGFGQHLMLDGYGCPYDYLTDLDRIYEFLNQCPDVIHMTKIMPPYAFKYSGKVPQDWGLSGFVLIAESHISVHTFPEKGYLSIDIFSCKSFDADKAIDYSEKVFRIATREIQLVDRGLEFPRNIGVVTRFLTDERKNMRI
ncbi:S-adenosylmethionine decarboxylase proenzyme [Desulfobacca acetoxidans DSM 11109]|uniref:S-adenosylmethionine decarboxylase proenzyme n=1 Tax=Desulfobacca acetoxidans (strain ATCC 700848 / DSM 11109 / ASRB2) TaxID=880072 RepID=F2NHT4_DESAR|nr:S-adenosylmethionine decarboxylase proenzyme [Desulfobacca acetoxidans DSM 11109]